MSDYPTQSDQDDALLRHALATLDRAATAQIRPPGSAAARARARQRRRRHRLAVGTVAALIAVPLAFDATGIGFPPWPQGPADHTTSGSSARRAAQGPPEILEGSTVTVDWTWVQNPDSCASGEMTVGDFAGPGNNTYAGSWVIDDVNGDGDLEVLVQFACHRSDGGLVAQMIALFSQEKPPTRESPGSYRQTGTVVRFEPQTPTENIAEFWLVGRHQLLVQIEDIAGCCEPPMVVTTRWRLYALTDPEFPQVPAPAPFDGDATLEFEVDYPEPVEFGPPNDAGVRTGEFILTLVNRSSRPVDAKVDLQYFDIRRALDDPACKGAICTLDFGSIPSGGSATRTLLLTVTELPTRDLPVATFWLRTTNQNGTFDLSYFVIKASDR